MLNISGRIQDVIKQKELPHLEWHTIRLIQEEIFLIAVIEVVEVNTEEVSEMYQGPMATAKAHLHQHLTQLLQILLVQLVESIQGGSKILLKMITS